VKYELDKLEEIVSVLLRPCHAAQQKDPQSFVANGYILLEAELERVKQQWILDSFSCEHDNRLSLYIKQHQRAVVRLSDMVVGFLSKQVAENIYTFPGLSNVVAYYTSIQYCLDQLLHFLRTNFSTYFDLDGKLDDYRRLHYAHHLKPIIKKHGSMLQRFDIDAKLIALLLHPLQDYCTAAAVSFARHDFIRKLEQAIAGLKDRTSVTNAAVCLLLIELNYNTSAFQEYYTSYLAESSRDTADEASIKAFYYLQLKLINQLPQVTDRGYDSTRPPLRELVGTWLAEEICFMEKKQQLMHFTGEIAEAEPKIHTSLSVAHLSLAVKLLVDAKIIKNKNSTELMKLVARNFKTDSRDKISEVSLRNKSYSYEIRTVDQMKDLVKGLMGVVMRY